MSFQICYSINILLFDAAGQRCELPTVFVNEPYSLCVMLVSNVYLVTTSQVRRSVVIVVIIIITIDVVVFIVVVIVVLLLLPTLFCFLLSSSPLVISCNVLFYFYSATQSAFMYSQTIFQSFIHSINMKWLPPILKSFEISFRKNRRSKKTIEFTQMNS